MSFTGRFMGGLVALAIAAAPVTGQEPVLKPSSVIDAYVGQLKPAQVDGATPMPSWPNLTAVLSSRRRAEPQFILTVALPDSMKRELSEDLQVMDRLLLRAIGGDAVQSGPYTRVLGVMVSNRDESRSRVQFIQGMGVVFHYQVGISVAPAASADGDDPVVEDQDSDWEAARRELFEASDPYAVYGRSSLKSVTYNEEVVSTMKSRVTEALANVAKIRHLAEANDASWPGRDSVEPGILVLIESDRDGSTLTLATTAAAMNRGGAGAVQTLQYHQAERHASPFAADFYRSMNPLVPGRYSDPNAPPETNSIAPPSFPGQPVPAPETPAGAPPAAVPADNNALFKPSGSK